MTATGAVLATASYTFDNNFLPTGLSLASAGKTVQAALTWDKDGLLTGFGPFTLTRGGPGGALSQFKDTVATTAYGYDTLARPATRTQQVNGQTPYTAQLSYDLSGRIVGKTETVGGVNTTYAYGYDPGGQLTEVRRNGAVTERYAYDANGNRTSRQLGGGAVETATYDRQDRLRQRGAVTYQFNSDGFLTQRGSDTFQYSTRGQLLQATVGGQTLTYGYDGLGRRISRTDSGGTTQYLYGDPASHLITAVRTPNGDFTTLYYDTAGLLTALERNGTRYYVATDQVGTPRVVSDATGASVKVLDYDSFGNLTSDSNPGFDLPLGYAGGLADTVIGLIHFGFRDYDPAAGRWTARDPVLFASGQGNLYVYVGNSPIGYRDPSGLFCISVTIYAGVGGGVSTCITDEGASVCGELGLGVGAGAEPDRFGDLEETGTSVGAEAAATLGPFEVGTGYSLDDKGCLKGGPKGVVDLADLLEESSTQLAEKFSGGLGKLKVGLEAKVAAKGCVQGKW
ncbi:MAG: RHS repeat-associated core domain-containing protein [Ignavibacteriaceae bacterium]|nr:MAG: RHS repeat-associated core domain-containing protein [Ignavibacteriaceae bacterium]